MLLPRLLLALLPGALATSPALAQTRVYELRGAMPGDSLGFAVDGAGDVDADGYDDLIVGAFGVGTFGAPEGAAFVFSGRDGSQLLRVDGAGPSESCGFSVSGAGDADADGCADVLVGCPFGATGTGYALLISGRDGSLLRRFDGEAAGDYFGISLDGAGDVDADGYDDVVVAAHQHDATGLNAGKVRVFSGRDGSILHELFGSAPEEEFGKSCAGAGDVDADGYADLVVGAWFAGAGGSRAGRACVFSGRDGSVLHTFDGDAPFINLGRAVAGAGDVDADGYADLVVGAHQDDVGGQNAGSARVYSGRDGRQLFVFRGADAWDLFGQSVAGAGDLDGDGYADLAVGANWDDDAGPNAGTVRAFSGRDGSELFTLTGPAPGAELGFAVAGAGDVNADGTPDLVAGAWLDGPGSAGVYLGGCPAPRSYCRGKRNSAGCVPRAVFSGAPVLSIGADDFAVGAEDVLNQETGIVFWGAARAEKPFFGGTLCVEAPLVRTPPRSSGGSTAGSDCSGTLEFRFTRAYMSAAGMAAGSSYFVQCWMRDRGLGDGVGLSDAVVFGVCP